MGKKKILTTVVAAAALFAVVMSSACGNAAQNTTAAQTETASETDAATTGQSSDKTVITMVAQYQGVSEFEEAFEAQYPEYDLQIEYLASGVINGEVLRRLRNDHGSDIMITNLPMGEVLDYVYDLTTQEFMEEYQERMMQTLAVDGKSFYVPLPGSIYGYIVNKTLLDELGLENPETSDDLLNIFATAKEKNTGTNADGYCFGIGTIGSTYLGAYIVSCFAPDFLSTAEGIKWLDDFNNGSATFTGTWEPSVDFLKACVDAGYINPDKMLIYYNQSMSSNANAFKVEVELPDRTAIAAYCDLYYYESVCSKSDDEFIFVPFLPQTTEGNALLSAVASDFMFINDAIKDDEKKLEGALSVLEFLSTKEGQQLWMQGTECPYSYLKDVEVDKDSVPESVKTYVENSQIYSNPFQTELLSVIGTQLIPVVTKGADLAEALLNIDDYCINGSQEVEQDLSVVGTVAEDMIMQNNNVRYEETQIGNLVADAVKELSGADVAIVNGGGIRSSLYKGDVTGSDLSAVCPYGNLIIVSEMDGATLKAAVTNGIQKTWKPAGQFLQVSGIKYSYKPAEDETQTAELLSLTYEDGTEVKDDDIISVAYNNYMGGSGTYVDSGDGFTMLNVYDADTPVNVKLISETDKTYKDALIEYFDNHKDEEITSPLEGRITVEK